MKRWRLTALAGAGVAAAVVVRRRLTRLPSLEGRSASESLRGADDTPLARAIAPLLKINPGLSGVHPLIEGYDAFAARMVLADAAERSLDVQYYIWEADLSGTLLFDALRRAAERGVRVRLLLDDNRTADVEPMLAELDAHPRIEVRLFNPFVIRGSRLIGYVTDFARLNRRMHNKSFTADGRATVIGGRNIADRYFATMAGSLFMDFDVLAVGTAADAVAADFDRYWACGSSYPAAAILRATTPAEQELTRARAAKLIEGAGARAFLDAVRDHHAVGALLDGRLAFDWAAVRLLSDDPAKGLGASPRGGLLIDHLEDALGPPRRELRIVSGYLVPSAANVRLFTEMAARGVCVTMLTNGFRAANVKPVFAAYSRWRRPLLAAGIRLFEVRNPAPGAPFGKAGGSGLTGSLGSSGAAFLHAKTFGVDRDRVFIGSFNFDPRSARLNTEQGFVIESPALAARMADRLAAILPETSCEVHLGDDGRLFWTEELNGRTVRHDTEPGANRVARAGMRVLSHLRLDWLL